MSKKIKDTMTISAACDELGYASRESIEQHVRAGRLRFEWLCPDHPSKTRCFFKEDVMKIKKQRIKDGLITA